MTVAAAVDNDLPRPHWRRVLLLGATSFYVPLTVLGDHPGFITRDYRLIVLAAGTLAAFLVLAWVLQRWFGRRDSTHLVFVLSLSLTLGGRTSGPTSVWTIGAVAVTILMLFIVWRLRDAPVLRSLLIFLAAALWVLAIFRVGAAAWVLWQGSESAAPVEASIVDPGGDVVVVIYDEYPGLTFAAEQIGVDSSALATDLAHQGFQVWGDLRANYAWSELALPAFFQMTLPKAAGERAEEGTRQALLGAIAGESAFYGAFVNAGFRVTVVESGWSGMRCMAAVDDCVERSWWDEVTWSVVRRSVVNGVVLSLAGDPFATGTERNIAWLRTDLSPIVTDDQRDLVVVHLQLPHTPVVFDSSCDRVVAARATLAGQVECANRLMLEVADTTGEAAVVVYFGDHGTKSLGQGSVPVANWSQQMVDERMGTFGAVRGLAQCRQEDPTSVTNLAVWLMRCLGSPGPGYVPDVSLATSLNGEALLPVEPRVGRH